MYINLHLPISTILYLSGRSSPFFLFIASLRVSKAMSITFALLLVGLILLVIGHFGSLIFNTIAGYQLIFCALGAWYMMASIIINDLAGKAVLPVGKPFIS